MLNLSDILKNYEDDISAVYSWSDDIYEHRFATFFNRVRELYEIFKSKTHPITDSELEEIITNLPLELFSVSEYLNKIRTAYEVIKLKRKEKRSKLLSESKGRNDTLRNSEADSGVIEDDILLLGYSIVIQRVENEISFCRELIMGAKKIYDRRKSTELASPILPVGLDDTKISTTSLPDYHPTATLQNKTYIK